MVVASRRVGEESVAAAGYSYSELGAEGSGKGSPWTRWRDKWLCMDKLIYWTVLGVIVGVGLGLGLYNANTSRIGIELIGYPGEMLLRALRQLVLPLIIFALMVGVLNLRNNPSGTGRIVRWALSYYLLSMVLAVAVGIILVQAIQPGRFTSLSSSRADSCSSSDSESTDSSQEKADKSVVDSLLNVGRDLIPTNIVEAAGLPNYLGIIVFSVIFAATVTTMGDSTEPLIQMIELCNKVILKIIRGVIVFTPVGVASLIAATILKACNLGGLLKALSLYVGTIVSGFLVHSVVVLPITMFALSRQNPMRAAKGFLPALVMGLGTSSSAAAMPLTMQNAEENMGIASSIVQFVVPLGTNINRDGAALYEAVSVIFILQAHGVSITAGDLMIVIITSTLAAIGSASVPSSALVTMITVLQALNYPEFIPDVALLYAVDWFLGMLRTSVNIWGDATAVVIVDSWAAEYAKKHETRPVVTTAHGSPQRPGKKMQEA